MADSSTSLCCPRPPRHRQLNTASTSANVAMDADTPASTGVWGCGAGVRRGGCTRSDSVGRPLPVCVSTTSNSLWPPCFQSCRTSSTYDNNRKVNNHNDNNRSTTIKMTIIRIQQLNDNNNNFSHNTKKINKY